MSNEATANPPEILLLTIAEVAEVLRCCPATVYREIADGKIETRKIRRKRYVHRDDLATYLEASRCADRPAEEVTEEVRTTRRRMSLKAMGLIGDDDFGPRKKGARPPKPTP